MFLSFLAYFNEKTFFSSLCFSSKHRSYVYMCTANFQVIAGLFWFLLQIMCKNSCLSFGRDGFMPPRDESDRKLRCTSKLSQSRAAAIMRLVNNTLTRTSIADETGIRCWFYWTRSFVQENLFFFALRHRESIYGDPTCVDVTSRPRPLILWVNHTECQKTRLAPNKTITQNIRVYVNDLRRSESSFSPRTENSIKEKEVAIELARN